ncbi:MAG TPA: PAS domain-containing protein [Dongiaceae bacterium]|jgi:hypothetical protein|nr:PAS domain-containing protein [Dongiaceae bacterium]
MDRQKGDSHSRSDREPGRARRGPAASAEPREPLRAQHGPANAGIDAFPGGSLPSMDDGRDSAGEAPALVDEALRRVSNDLKNLLDSTQIAMMLLDRALRLTSFTAGMTDVVRLGSRDQGRPIGEIGPGFP